MRLPGGLREKLEDTMVQAFTRQDLAKLVRHRFDRNLEEIVSSEKNLRDLVFELLDTAEREEWLEDLVRHLQQSRPRNAPLLEVFAWFDLKSSAPRRTVVGIESVAIGQAGAEAATCLVEVQPAGTRGYSRGTGFLIGPDLVVTAAHTISAARSGADIVVRFDFLQGQPEDEQTTVALAGEWLAVQTDSASPVEDEAPTTSLNLAVIRLALPAGELPIGRSSVPTAKPRGWLVPRASDLRPSSPMSIVQHQHGGPMVVRHDPHGVVRPIRLGTRFLHRVETAPGSSGAPCFDEAWRLIGIHHTRRPDQLREATPIIHVVELLRRVGIELRTPPE